MKQRLKGRRIAALAADGFEKVELVVPMKALRAAGAHVDVISLRQGNIRGVNLHEPASRVHVDKTLAEANPANYDGLLLPGGFINPDLLRQSAAARAFVRAFDEAGKPIASLCHGPWVLASAGLLQGRTLTSWPGVRDDLVNAGATWRDQPFIRDGNLATSRGPQDMIPFVQGCLDLFALDAPIPRTTQPPVSRSAPQANEPPDIVLGRIVRWAADHFGATPPNAIVLTHAHFDHVGAIDDLPETWSVPVYAHPEELPYVRGERAYPPPDPTVGGGMMARMASLYPRGPIDLGARVRALPADGSIPILPGWRWVHTPGRTPGHVSLFRDVDRALIVGDAFCTTKQESFFAAMGTQRPELHGPPAYFTTDWEAARDSVQRLASLQPAFIAPGHGQPMAGVEVTRALVELSDRFDDVARPEQGRYVQNPTRR